VVADRVDLTDDVDEAAWFRSAAVEMSVRYGEPVLYLPDGVRRDAAVSSGSHGLLPYLTLLSQANAVERNSPHEIVGAPQGDTIQ
jgi:hypothetical protein